MTKITQFLLKNQNIATTVPNAYEIFSAFEQFISERIIHPTFRVTIGGV
jgi:hypothetical protein